MDKRYVIMARWHTDPNDPEIFDTIKKEVKTRAQVIGIVNFLQKEIKPYQISITDREEGQKVERTEEDNQKHLDIFNEDDIGNDIPECDCDVLGGSCPICKE